MDLPDNFYISISEKNLSYGNNSSFEHINRIIMPSVLLSILIIGVIGNILVIIAVTLNRDTQNNSTFLLIGNLAAVDLLFLIFSVPYQNIGYVLTEWPFLNVWCSITLYLQYVASYISVWTLTVIAFDRYLAVIFPIKSRHLRTTRNSALLIILLWIIITAACLPYLNVFGVYEFFDKNKNRTNSVCLFVGLATRQYSEVFIRTYFSLWITFVFVLPLTITCVLYIRVLHKLWSRVSIPINRIPERNLETARKVTYTVAIVTVTFAVCWFPLHVCYSYRAITYKQYQRTRMPKEYLITEAVSRVLAFTISCAFPIIYSSLSQKFRERLSHAFYFCICNHKRKRSTARIVEESEMALQRNEYN